MRPPCRGRSSSCSRSASAARAYMQAARQASIAPEDSACRREAVRAEAQYDEDLDILAVAIHGHDACAWPQ